MYKERHAIANGLALANTIDYRLKPLLAHFGDRPLAEIRTADVEDFIADLRKPRIVHRRGEPRPLAPEPLVDAGVDPIGTPPACPAGRLGGLEFTFGDRRTLCNGVNAGTHPHPRKPKSSHRKFSINIRSELSFTFRG